jgi:hypothetical protein
MVKSFSCYNRIHEKCEPKEWHPIKYECHCHDSYFDCTNQNTNHYEKNPCDLRNRWKLKNASEC